VDVLLIFALAGLLACPFLRLPVPYFYRTVASVTESFNGLTAAGTAHDFNVIPFSWWRVSRHQTNAMQKYLF